jgi:hypothetical protein
LATITTAFVLWQANFDPVGKENQHRTAAKELLWIREQLLLLIERCHVSSTPLVQLQSGLDTLTRELTSVYKFAPNTSPEAYGKADSSLKKANSLLAMRRLTHFCQPRFEKTRGRIVEFCFAGRPGALLLAFLRWAGGSTVASSVLGFVSPHAPARCTGRRSGGTIGS